jgi:HSP20 family protein
MASDRTQEQNSNALSPNESWGLANPFSMMRRFSNEVEHMFDDFWSPRRRPGSWRTPVVADRWAPDIEMFERKGELVLRADLPGLTRDDVKVELSDGSIVIHGERKAERETTERGYYACERTYGSFYRAVPMPEGVKVDDAKASFKNGVLEVTVPAPRLPERHGRQLEIRSA